MPAIVWSNVPRPDACDAMGVVQGLRPVDADADADIILLEQIAPFARKAACRSSERMAHVARLGPQRLDRLEGLSIEGDGTTSGSPACQMTVSSCAA